MTIRICHVISSLDLGGAQKLLARLCLSLPYPEFRHRIICLTGYTELVDDLRKSNVRVDCLEMSRVRYTAQAVFKLRRILKAEQPHLVHTWLYHADLVSTIAMVGMKLCPLIWSVHHANEKFAGDKKLTKWLVKLLALLSARFPATVIYCSAYARKVHQKLGYNPRNSVLINNGIDTDRFKPSTQLRKRFREQQGLGTNTSVVGMVARFTSLKGHDVFLKMARELLSQHCDVKFVMIGTDVVESNPELSNALESLGLREKCLLLGEQSEIEVYLNGMDVLVCPSFSESFGLIVVEALACGVPVVCSRLEVLKMFVDEKYMASAGDASTFAEKVYELITTTQENKNDIGWNGREKMIREFGEQAMISRYRETYYETIGMSSVIPQIG